MKKLFFAILLLPIVTLAQAGSLSVGERTVSYDSWNETEVGTLYYQGENLVASEHTGLTLVYENDEVILEAHDTDGDGELDAFLTLDSNEEVTEMTGEGADTFERPEVVEFEELLTNDGGSDATAEDLVGSLDSIKIPGKGGAFGKILLVLVLIGGGYWFYKKKRMTTPNLTSDIDEARNALEPATIRLKGLLQLWTTFSTAKMVAEEYHSKFDSLSLPLKLACTRALVVEYYKPWSGNRSDVLNSLKDRPDMRGVYQFLAPVVADPLHLALEEVRNRLYGHIDNDYEGHGVTVNGRTIPNQPANRTQDPGTLDDVFLPATITLASKGAFSWLDKKQKIEEICKHVKNAIGLTEQEIRVSTATFRDLCIDHMHVLKSLTDLFSIEEFDFQNGNIEVTSHSENSKPIRTSNIVSMQIGNQHLNSLVAVFEPRPDYLTNVEIEGKGYKLQLQDFDENGKLGMTVTFPKYPFPKIKPSP